MVLEQRLLQKAEDVLDQGKTKEAVRLLEELVHGGGSSSTLNTARLKLAYAYMLLDTPGNIAKALELNKQAGVETVRVYIRNDRAPLKVGDRELRQLSRRQIVGIDKIVGDWYRVATIDDQSLEPHQVGFVYKTAFEPPKPSTPPTNPGMPTLPRWWPHHHWPWY